VPKDLAVIAFTDGIISKYSTPTYHRESKRQNGKQSGKMLIDRLEEEHEEEEDEVQEN
jgi:LacI family transcriptional regulator